ncbi:unnamed protein product [Paramecium sonneborni]|uniref:Uncharacterized protein n=1 Tax=Paramecium sonneborni TaxID=65129 RepID=A0A8S1LLJ9_9CILI|nr:unnamed protein product [Paramecium sonneborni]
MSQTNTNNTISGRMILHQSQKQEKSYPFFKDTRVNSCSYIQMKKGNPYAIPYYEIANKSQIDNQNKSTYITSTYNDDYKPKPNFHVGSEKKALQPYTMGSFRSRLPQPDAPILTKNASQVEIGDRHFNVKRHFLSTAHNVYGNFGKFGNISNPGILSEKTKWHHHLQQL